MEAPTRVLIVEDLSPDAALAEREIKKSLKLCVFECVDTRKDFLKALAEFRPDIVVTDYRMPQFDGLTALKLSLEREPLTPVIILTSAINEDTAVQCMKTGAADYVIKEHIKRLGQAVVRALEEKKVRIARVHAEQELRVRDFAIKSSISAIGLADLDGRITYVNDAFRRMWKYQGDDKIIGRQISEFALLPQVAFDLIRSLQTGDGYIGEAKALCADGSAFDAQVSASMVENQEGRPICMMASFVDVSERRRAEERQSTILQTIPLVLYTAETPSPFDATWMTENVVRVTGIPSAAFVQQPGLWSQRIHPGDKERVEKAFSEILSGRQMEVEYRWKCSDDTYRWFLDRATSLHQTQDGKIEYSGIWLDITERKKAEQQIEAWHGRYELVAAAGRMLFYDCCAADDTIHWSESIKEVLGFSLAEMSGGFGKWLELIHPEDKDETVRLFDLAERDLSTFDAVYRFRSKAGQYVVMHDRGYPVKDEGTGKIRFVGVMEDITRRKQMESTLHLTQFSVDRASVGIIRTGADARILAANDMACKSLGYSREEIRALTVPDIDPDFSITRWLSHREELKKRGSLTIESVHRRKDGTTFPVEITSNYIEYEGEGFTFSFVHDITARQQDKERIEEQARLLDVARDAIIVRDMSDKLVYLNRAAQDLYGWTFDEARMIPSHELMVESDRAAFLQQQAAFMEGGEWEGELRQKTKGGKELIIQTRRTLVRDKQGRPSAQLIINRDVTEQRKLEAQFRRAQRMESLGTLAGGIAHDLNNVLAPITMSLALLDRRVTDPDLKRYIATLESSAERGSDIVKQVLLFARGSEKDFAPQQLRYIVRETATIIQETFPRNIELQTDVSKDLTFVLGDATQLHQVLMNLCVNARDAMPEGGRLTIAASNVTLSGDDAKMQMGGHPGNYVVVSVSDTGTGILKEIQERIFEPFFTTKDLGKGTGLGLSTVYAIVKDHKGFINFYSEVEKGAAFKVYLPAIQHQEATQPTVRPLNTPSGHGELILVVDDEQAGLEITREILEARGYRVLTAANGAEGISAFAAAPKGSVQLVLTDVNMPGMDGPTAVEAIRRLDPDVRVIISSGLVADLEAANKKELRIQGYLMKPFTSERMLTTIYEVLNEGRQ